MPFIVQASVPPLFDFQSTVKLKKPNSNSTDKDKVKITFDLESLVVDYPNATIRPETTNGTVVYNGDGQRIVDLFVESPIHDMFKVVPQEEGYFKVTLNVYGESGGLIFSRDWYFYYAGDGVEEAQPYDYERWKDDAMHARIYQESYRRAVAWTQARLAEGYTPDQFFEYPDNGEDYFTLDCTDETILVHNHTCPVTRGSYAGISAVIGKPLPPAPPYPLRCYLTTNNHYYTIKGNVLLHDTSFNVGNQDIILKNFNGDFVLKVEVQIQITCSPILGGEKKATLVNRTIKVPIDENGNFQATILCYIDEQLYDQPVLTFKLTPQNVGINIDNCSYELKSFDLIGEDAYNKSSKNPYTYTVQYSDNSNTYAHMLHWAGLISKLHASGIAPFNSFFYKVAFDEHSTALNYYTYQCNGDPVTVYPDTGIEKEWTQPWIVYHELNHQWYEVQRHQATGDELPGGEHSFCEDDYGEDLIFSEGFADWDGTYMTTNLFSSNCKWMGGSEGSCLWPEITCESYTYNLHIYRECYSSCDCYQGSGIKRSESQIHDFLWDVFDSDPPEGSDNCADSDRLNGVVCVDFMDKDVATLASGMGCVGEMGFYDTSPYVQPDGTCPVGSEFFVNWDSLRDDPVTCDLLHVNCLEACTP